MGSGPGDVAQSAADASSGPPPKHEFAKVGDVTVDVPVGSTNAVPATEPAPVVDAMKSAGQ